MQWNRMKNSMSKKELIFVTSHNYFRYKHTIAVDIHRAMLSLVSDYFGLAKDNRFKVVVAIRNRTLHVEHASSIHVLVFSKIN